MVSATHPNRRLTYDDLLLFPEDDRLRHEIIDGVHYVTAAPNLRHQDLVGRLYLAIGNFLASHPGIGRVFVSPVDVVFTIHDVVGPDLVFVAGDQTDILTEANIQGAPAIVVEILSKSTRSRDERIKKQLFDRGGVREYWMVDPDRSQLIVHLREVDGFHACAPLSAAEGAVLTTPLLPGFSLSLSELFQSSL
jgi:Uma2 family endonuclease